MSDVYKIGIAISLTNNVSQVLGVIARDMMGLNVKAKELQGTFNRIKLAAVGAAGVMAGTAVLRGMGHLIEHGQKLVQQQSLLLQAGVSQQDVAFATGEAYRVMNSVLGTGVTENLELLGDLRNRLGDIHAAAQALPELAKVGAVLAVGTGKSAAEAGDQFARFLELRGALVNPVTEQIDPARLKEQARLGEAIAVGTRFKVGPSELLAFQQQARAAGASQSEQGLINMVPYIQAGGGHRTGTQLSSLLQQTIGGVMTKAGAQFFEHAGLLDASRVNVGKGGKISIRDDDGKAWKDEGLLRTDTATWINTTFRAGLEGMGAKTVDQQTVATMRSHLRATVVGLLVEGVRSAPAFVKDAGLITQARGTDQYGVMMGEPQRVSDSRRDRDSYEAARTEKPIASPVAKMKAFREAWDNLLTALGAPMVETAYNMLGVVTRKLTDLAAWAGSHQGIVIAIEGATTALAGLSIAAGVFAIGSTAASALGVLAGPVGLAAVAIGIVALRHALQGVDTETTPGEMARAGLSPKSPAIPNPLLVAIREMMPTAADIVAATKDFVPRATFALADSILQVGTEIGHGARRLFDEAASEVVTGLGKITSAIMNWITGLPSQIGSALLGIGKAALDAAGIKSPVPGTENHPNGIALPGPTFGPQHLGDPSQAPKAGPQHLGPPGPTFGPQHLGDPSQAPKVLGSYVPPAGGRDMHITNVIYLDGEVVARNTERRISRRMNASPLSGATGPDMRISPYAGSLAT